MKVITLHEPEHGRRAVTLQAGPLTVMVGYFAGGFRGPRAYRLLTSRAFAAYALGVLLIGEWRTN